MSRQLRSGKMVITSAIVPKRFYNKTVKQKATVEAANETSMGSLRLEESI
jgi:hypothetical protein